MTKKIVYVAQDGKEFTTEEGCRKYEDEICGDLKIISNKNNIIFYNRHGNVIENFYADDKGKSYPFLEEAYLIDVKNYAAIQALKNFAWKYGYKDLLPKDIGLYYYNPAQIYSGWVFVPHDITKIIKKIF